MLLQTDLKSPLSTPEDKRGWGRKYNSLLHDQREQRFYLF